MSNLSNQVVGLLPTPGDSATSDRRRCSVRRRIPPVHGLQGVFRRISKAMDGGVRKIGLGILATLVGAGIAATRQALSSKDEHAS